jgi:hypothetical protein
MKAAPRGVAVCLEVYADDEAEAVLIPLLLLLLLSWPLMIGGGDGDIGRERKGGGEERFLSPLEVEDDRRAELDPESIVSA